MEYSNRIIPALLLVLGSLAAGAALAQQPEPRQAQQAQAAPATSGAGAAAPSDQAVAPTDQEEEDQEEAPNFPIFAITSAEVLRTAHAPTTDILLVNGVTSADGWDGGELVPLRHGPSPDGVLDLIFVAHPPMESAAPSHYVPIQAVLMLAEGHPFKGVRVRAGTNSLLVQIPGYAQAKAPVELCNGCVGKTFVAKGADAPKGVAAANTVREEDLPPMTRIIHPDDGIADTRPNPNRLTIVIGEDGRIADAAWE